VQILNAFNAAFESQQIADKVTERFAPNAALLSLVIYK
jgi:hypothetical protein